MCVCAARTVNMLMHSGSALFKWTTRRKCEWNTTSPLHKIFSLFRKPICTINVQTVTRHKLHTHTQTKIKTMIVVAFERENCVQIFASHVDDFSMCSSVRLSCVCVLCPVHRSNDGCTERNIATTANNAIMWLWTYGYTIAFRNRFVIPGKKKTHTNHSYYRILKSFAFARSL